MITVEQALAHLFDLVTPLPGESVALRHAAGRVLSEPVTAGRDQPPFAASAMDGYAVIADEARHGARFRVTAESAAGRAADRAIAPGEAIRIFTGAPMPKGATRVIIQEDVIRDGDTITLRDALDESLYIRPAAADFAKGSTCFPRRALGPSDLVLLAAMNCATPAVVRRPVVALIATGDELVMPGEIPGPDQIVASNIFGLAAMIEAAGGTARLLPIARDSEGALRAVFSMTEGVDLIVTIGGASVGDHDLVGAVAGSLGMEQAFYKIAMRPGKPLMAGRLNGVPMVGLPGNPVSAMVCGHVFLLPMLRAMLGLTAEPAPRLSAPLAAPLGPNGPREHYMRASFADGRLTAFNRQDSALTSVLAAANALILRPVGDGPRAAGDQVVYLPL